MTLGAAIFDLDGVLADSAVMHFAAWKRLADDLGIAFDKAANEALKGVDRMGSLRLLLALGDRTASPTEMQAMADVKNAYFVEMIGRATPADLLPGAERLLAEARAAGLKLAVASASRNAPALLTKLSIAERFDFIADAGAIANPKPAPEIFLTCADALGVDPARCIGFEDAAAGIEAIRAARMFAVGIGDAQSLARAHIIYRNTEAVDLAAVLARSAAVSEKANTASGGAWPAR